MDPPAAHGPVEEVALTYLRTRGLTLTTLADIAQAADLQEADLHRRYGDTGGLIGHLVAPLLDRLHGITASAAGAELRRADELRQVIEEYLDALTAHRVLVSVVLGDPAASSSEAIQLVRRAIQGLRDELARGLGSGLEDRIRAASALGALQAAVLEPTELDPAVVRDVIVDAAVAILLS